VAEQKKKGAFMGHPPIDEIVSHILPQKKGRNKKTPAAALQQSKGIVIFPRRRF